MNEPERHLSAPTHTAPRNLATPDQAVRMELRAALHDLVDALLDGQEAPVLLVSIRHLWVLMELAGASDSVAAHGLRSLARALRTEPGDVDRSLFANQLSSAADRL